MFAQKGLDLSDPNIARQFLGQHTRYYTLNPWNQLTSYANNVRITRLDLTKAELDFAWDLVCDEDLDTFEYEIAQHEVIDRFNREHHCDVFFNGRSGGWLVIVPRGTDGRPQPKGFPPAEDFDDIDEMVECAQTIDAFDRLCDELSDLIRYFAANATIETKEVTYTVTKRRVTIP